VDIIGYLFDQTWVPHAVIDPFRTKLFLQRLSVLEQAATELTDGETIPIPLLRGSEYFLSGMGPRLPRFREDRHRVLLRCSLRELRDFGELGRSLRLTKKKPTVTINIWSPDGYAEEVIQFARPDYNLDE